MTPLNEFLKSNKEFEFEGRKYTMRPLAEDEEGQFAVWLEQRAYDAIERRVYQSEEQKIQDRRVLNQDVTIGLYEYGGLVSIQAIQWPPGIAKVISIVCREQGMTEAVAKRFVNHKLKEIAVAFVSQLPNVSEEAMGALLNRYGFPADFFKRDLKPSSETISPVQPEEAPAG